MSIVDFTIILLFFIAASDSQFPDRGKSTSAKISASRVKKIVRECFADFLVLQFGEKTKMHGATKKQFILDPQLVEGVKLRDFMHGNEEKTAQLWNCVNNVRPFPQNSGNKRKLAELWKIFRMEITKIDAIVPSQHVQEKLQSAQCLLDLGVIEGKILTQNGKISEHEEEEVEWFKELEEAREPIVVSAEGAVHMVKCLHKGKPFEVKLANKGPATNEHLLYLSDTIDRSELIKHCKLVTLSEWLIKKIVINGRQKRCFADLFVLHFGVQTFTNGKRQFRVQKSMFPERDSIAGLNANEMQKFMDCLINGASPFSKYFVNRHKQVDNLVKDFCEHDIHSIAPSQIVQRRLYNAQCWLDLGAFEGKMKTKCPKIVENYTPGEEVPWLQELESADHKPIVVSHEGAALLSECLHKRAPFKVKLKEEETGEKHQWHLQLLDPAERVELFKTMEQIPFSLWLYKENSKEESCVADFLVKHEFAQTTLDPADLKRRMIVWNSDNGSKWTIKFQEDSNNRDSFEKLRSCIFRKAALLKADAGGKQFIDLEPLFKLTGGHIYVDSLLNKELDTQSDCLAKFLAIKSGVKCLLKKKKGPTGVLLNLDFTEETPFRPYIFNFGDIARAYALSAEKCHLPDGETGVYSEGSEQYKQLWECGVRMTTTTEQEGGSKVMINVRDLMKIYIPTQLFLREIPIELLPTTIVAESRTESQEIDCAICQQSFVKDDIIATAPCQHHYHRHCVQKWIEGQDSCPFCRASILIDVPYDDDDQPSPQSLSVGIPTAAATDE